MAVKNKVCPESHTLVHGAHVCACGCSIWRPPARPRCACARLRPARGDRPVPRAAQSSTNLEDNQFARTQKESSDTATPRSNLRTLLLDLVKRLCRWAGSRPATVRAAPAPAAPTASPAIAPRHSVPALEKMREKVLSICIEILSRRGLSDMSYGFDFDS